MKNQYLKKEFKPTKEQSSVHYEDEFRMIEAKKQASMQKVKVEIIIEHTNFLLGQLDIKVPCQAIYDPAKIDYEKIKQDNNLEDRKDIVWMKFTKDGYLGVVAASDDINFNIPKSKENYNEKNSKNKWEYNTSGILIHSLEKEWDESFVLIFPLSNIPEELSRSDIECAIGDYLINQNVPILDYYSHRY